MLRFPDILNFYRQNFLLDFLSDLIDFLVFLIQVARGKILEQILPGFSLTVFLRKFEIFRASKFPTQINFFPERFY